MESIYLVLTATGTLFSRCIGLYTKERYNHISLCLNSEIREFYSFGRKIRWFPLIGGFIVERVDSGVFKAFGKTTCVIFKLDICDEKYGVIKQTVDKFINNKKKYGYNLIGLLCVMLNMPLKRKNKYFCTQFVADVMQECGIYDFGKDPSLVTPRDFYDIPELVPVYEGRLCDLSKAVNVKAVPA